MYGYLPGGLVVRTWPSHIHLNILIPVIVLENLISGRLCMRKKAQTGVKEGEILALSICSAEVSTHQLED